MTTYKEIIQAYLAAWSENDEEQRRALLASSWEDNGVYTDPGGQALGREALIQHIGAFQRRYPDYQLQLTSGVDEHHQQLRFTWALIKPDGSHFIEGTDFGEVRPGGHLLRLTGFFGPLPRASSPFEAS